jgi:hypothetical protein
LLRGFTRFIDPLARCVGDIIAQLFAGLRRKQQSQHRTDTSTHEEIC